MDDAHARAAAERDKSARILAETHAYFAAQRAERERIGRIGMYLIWRLCGDECRLLYDDTSCDNSHVLPKRRVFCSRKGDVAVTIGEKRTDIRICHYTPREHHYRKYGVRHAGRTDEWIVQRIFRVVGRVLKCGPADSDSSEED